MTTATLPAAVDPTSAPVADPIAPARPALGIIDGEPAAQYHSTPAVSFHRLMDFDPAAGGSPALYFYRHIARQGSKETKALTMGRAIHCYILEGDAAFEREFVVAPKGTKFNTTEGKRWKEEAETGLNKGKTIISHEDFQDLPRMRAAAHANPTINQILSAGRPEVTVRVRDPINGCVKQARFDWLDINRQPVVAALDLKKTAKPLEEFHWEVKNYQYDRQIAWYSRLLAEALNRSETPLPWSECADIADNMVNAAVEDFPTWRAQAFGYERGSMETCDAMNQRAFQQLHECSMTNTWPDLTGSAAIRLSTR
jgi:hypothetical protein